MLGAFCPGGRPLLAIADILVPVFAVIALGYLLTRVGFLSERALRDLNSLTYWVGLPSLLVHRVAAAPPEVASVAGLLAVTVGATGVAIAIGVVCGRLLGLAPELRGTFTQGVFRGNLAFIGLPVVMYASPRAGWYPASPIRRNPLASKVPSGSSVRRMAAVISSSGPSRLDSA